jgi:hypothetical protein
MYNQQPYYQETREKPTTAFALSLVSGIFILLGGMLFMIVPSLIGFGLSFIPGLGGIGIGVFLFGMIGVLWGIIVIVGASMMNSCSIGRVRAGAALVLVFSIISWFGAFGGFFFGFLLGLIGAIMGLTWHPSIPQYVQQPIYAPQQQTWAPQPQQQTKRICSHCGCAIDENVRFCPNCGSALN